MSRDSGSWEAKPLTIEEGKQLAAYWRDGPTVEEWPHFVTLRDRALIYGQEGIEALPFVGLEPRYQK